MQNLRKIELVLGLLIVVLLMSTPMFNPLCRGGETETLKMKTVQLPFMVGDLLFMDSLHGDFMVGSHNDHCVICVEILEDDARFVSAGIMPGVHYVTYSVLQEYYCNFLIARVKNMQPWQIDAAVSWAKNRADANDPYQRWFDFPWHPEKWYIPYDPEHPNSDGWYCTEIVWAAYYNIQENPRIDIDYNEWTKWPCPWEASVNAGCPNYEFLEEHPWIKEYVCPYFFKNEILIDDDVNAAYKPGVISGLPAGTKIQMWNGGTVNIENVQAGNVVVSYDTGQDQIVPAIVEAVYYYPPAQLTDNFVVINDDFQVTDNHELYVNDWWMFAEDVQVGDKLLVYSNGNLQNVTVDTLEAVTENIGGYALELDSSLGVLASYFADNILVCE